METLFIKLFEIFSLEYMFAVIIASYFGIKLVDLLNGTKRSVPTWQKRVITFVIGSALFAVFSIYTSVTTQSLIASYFCAIFVYDAAIKVIIKKLGLEYK